MSRLPVELALEMHYWHELSSREISDGLEVPAPTIRSRIARGRELLRKELATDRSTPKTIEAALDLLGDDAKDA